MLFRSCLEAKYPADSTVVVNQSQFLDAFKITVQKIEFTKFHTRAYVTIENISGNDEYVSDKGVIIQGKKQFEEMYIFSDYPSISSSIPSGVEEEGYIIYKPILSKTPFQLIFTGDTTYSGDRYYTNKAIFNINP